MESLLHQFAPAMQRASEATSGGSAQGSIPPITTPLPTKPPENKGKSSAATTPDIDRRDDPLDEGVTDQFGQLALDSHGHLRWIGSSSSIALIEAFRNMSDTPSAYNPIYPPEQDRAVNRLFFAPSLGFGTRVKALPGPEEVEYPPRDLADKLVCGRSPSTMDSTIPLISFDSIGHRILRVIPPNPSCARLSHFYRTISTTYG
jgi:hypothetical protein